MKKKIMQNCPKALYPNLIVQIKYELENTQITEILWEHSVGFVQGIDCTAEYLTATMERDWRIRDRPTGNWEQHIANVTYTHLQK